jgi:glutathione S-transferase
MPNGSHKRYFRYIFNSAQRAHLNFVENIASILFAVTFGGLYYPLVEIGFGLAIAVGRLIYALGYSTKGPKGRSIGAALSAIGLLGSISLCITTGIKIIQGYSPGSPN